MTGRICLRLSEPLPGLGVTAFGVDAALFTPELVLRRKLDRVAMEMHEIYRRSVGEEAPTWQELSPFLRSSKRAAADHLPAKLSLLLGGELSEPATAELCGRAFRQWQQSREEQAELYQELEHRRWMRFYALHNWQRGARDNALRRHPSMSPFRELPPEERAKDDYAWALLGDLAEARGEAPKKDG